MDKFKEEYHLTLLQAFWDKHCNVFTEQDLRNTNPDVYKAYMLMLEHKENNNG